MAVRTRVTAFLRLMSRNISVTNRCVLASPSGRIISFERNVKQVRECQKLRVGFAPITADTDIDLERHRKPETKAGLFHFGLGEMLGFL